MNGWELFFVAVAAIALMLVLYKDAPKFMSKWVWIPTTLLALVAGGTLLLSPPGQWLTDAIRNTAGFLGSLGPIGVGAGWLLGLICLVLVVWALLALMRKEAPMALLVTVVVLPLAMSNVSGSVADPVMSVYSGFGEAGQSAIAELATEG